MIFCEKNFKPCCIINFPEAKERMIADELAKLASKNNSLFCFRINLIIEGF